MFVVKRSPHNPLLIPLKTNRWESIAAFNWCPVKKGKTIHCVYRAIGPGESLFYNQGPAEISTVGHVTSTDGVRFENHRQLIVPEHPWEKYGCEDPRVTFFEGKYYIFYTALSVFPFNAQGIKVAVAITSDFEKIEEKHPVTPFNAKAMVLFPERINGKIVVMVTVNTDMPPAKIALAELDTIQDLWNEDFWKKWYAELDAHIIDLSRTPGDHIEVGAPPLLTERGWVLVYSHIQHYFEGKKVFGIETVLLDRDNPSLIIGRSKGPLIVPEEIYEQYGLVSGIAFPSGALIDIEKISIKGGPRKLASFKMIKKSESSDSRRILHMYYGAADTTCARAEVDLEDLLDTMLSNSAQINSTQGNSVHSISAQKNVAQKDVAQKDVAQKNTKKRAKNILKNGVRRFEQNPILLPQKTTSLQKSAGLAGTPDNWQLTAVFNPAAIDIDGKICILYRAMSSDNTSTVGYAESLDGVHIDLRLDTPIYVPREAFELKKIPNGNSGCEDPRVVRIGDRIYMTYTAYNGIQSPAIAVTSIAVNDFIQKKWNWEKPIIISPTEIDDKDSCILPEKIDGQYLILHRAGISICGDFVKVLDFQTEKINKCIEIMMPRPGMWDGKKIGIAAPPIKTKKGWLLFYHGISEKNIYRVGAALLDLKDPTQVISRITDAVLEPEMEYEINGQVPNVVFPCGVVLRKDTLYMYYGGGDSVLCGATLKLSKILGVLSSHI